MSPNNKDDLLAAVVTDAVPQSNASTADNRSPLEKKIESFAFQTFQQVIRKLKQKETTSLYDPNPSEIVHFTSLQAMERILATQTFRATHALYTNDDSELSHSLELFQREMPALLEELDASISFQRLCEETLKAFDLSDAWEVFLVSFSAVHQTKNAGDRADEGRLWMSYGRNTECAVALHFNREEISNYGYGDRGTIELANVEYDPPQQREIFRLVLQTFQSRWLEATNRWGADGASDLFRFGLAFTLDWLLPLIKNDFFSREREVRACVRLLRIDSSVEFNRNAAVPIPCVSISPAKGKRINPTKVRVLQRS